MTIQSPQTLPSRLALGWFVLVFLAGSWPPCFGSTDPSHEQKYRHPIDDLVAIREHLLMADPSDRPHLRFLTLSHLVNNPRTSSQDLRTLRVAVSKLINSLSWQSEISHPVAVSGTDGAVLAIDLRRWRWSDGKQWLQIIRLYPYGLKRSFVRDAAIKEAAEDIEQLTGSEMAYLRADWFVYAASRPPLYYQLLQAPSHLDELFQQLDAPKTDNISANQGMRAGISQSKVAQQNRLVERYESKFGAVWLTYDFSPRQGRGDLIRYPLGPKKGVNAFHHYAFEHTSNFVLYHLPNGLLAFYVADSQGTRRDGSLSPEIAYDPDAASGTASIVTGISCMRCHARGVVPEVRDEIRAASILGGEAKQILDRLYVPPAQLEKWIERDNQQFAIALRAAMSAPSPSLRASTREENPSEDAEDEHDSQMEPISVAVRKYQRDLGPAEVAYELGIQNIDSIRTPIENDRELKRLGLGVLLQENPGVVKRARWEAIDGTSFFQDVAVELGLGTPFLPGTTADFTHPISINQP